MKNYKLFLVILGLITFGCTDLEEDPVGLLSPSSFYTSAKDVQLSINGAVGQIASENYWGRKYGLSIMLMGDMMDIGNQGTPSRRVQINNFTSDANNGMTAVFWPRSYRIIGTLNEAIAASTRVVEDEKVRDELIGQARFLRAFIYFNLVRVFSDVPYIDVVVTDPLSLTDISKTGQAEIYEKIIEDLNFAKDNLPMVHTTSSRSLPAKGSAYTALADVYLTLGRWQEAYDSAKYVIDNAGALGYTLEADYEDLFNANSQQGSSEHIFAVEFKGQLSSYPYNADILPFLTGIGNADIQGWNVTSPTQKVYDTWDARDYRRKVAIVDSTYIGGDLRPYTEFDIPRPHCAKYWKFGNDSGNNYAVYRFAEVYLIAAEALNEIGGPSGEAIAYVNVVRERARNWNGTMTSFPSDITSGVSKEEFLDLILEERRFELSFELKRWWDIKRRNMGAKVFAADGLESQPAFTNDKYLLGIPQAELDRNPNLKPQNPSY